MPENPSNNTADNIYTIYFRGETLNNLAPTVAQQNLAQLFKLPIEKITPLFSGNTVALKKNIKIAVMGCAVNGPGESMEADIGIAGGKGEGLVYKKGKPIKKVPENQMLDFLMQEIERM